MSCGFSWFPELLIVSLLNYEALGISSLICEDGEWPVAWSEWLRHLQGWMTLFRVASWPPRLHSISHSHTQPHIGLCCELGRPSWPVVSPQACRERDVLPTAKVNNSAPDSAGPVSPLQLWFNQTEGEVKPDAALSTGRPDQNTQSEKTERDSQEGRTERKRRNEENRLDAEEDSD